MRLSPDIRAALHRDTAAAHAARKEQLELVMLEAQVEAMRESVRAQQHARMRADIKLTMLVLITAAGLIDGAAIKLLEFAKAIAGMG